MLCGQLVPGRQAPAMWTMWTMWTMWRESLAALNNYWVFIHVILSWWVMASPIGMRVPKGRAGEPLGMRVPTWTIWHCPQNSSKYYMAACSMVAK